MRTNDHRDYIPPSYQGVRLQRGDD